MDLDKYVSLLDLEKYHSKLMEGVSSIEDIAEIFFDDVSDLFECESGSISLKEGVSKSSLSGAIILPTEINEVKCRSYEYNLFRETLVTSLFIPKSYNEAKLYSAQNYVGTLISSLKEVYIDNDTIPQNAFRASVGGDKIELVYMTDRVRSLGSSAFHDCENLKKIRLSENLSEIPSDAFRDCYSLKEIDLPKNLKSIGSGAFSYCYDLKEITLPKTLNSLSNSFSYSGLESITIPDSVTSSPLYGTFEGCDSLEIAVVGNSIGELNGTFKSAKKLRSVVLGSGLKTISNGAFEGCTSLRSISIPDNVTSINNAFKGCSSLTTINIGENNSIYSAENGIIYNKAKTKIYEWPTASGEITVSLPYAEYTFRDNDNITGVILNTPNLYYRCFYSCNNLESVSLPEGLTTIPKESFFATKISSIVIPSTVKTIDENAFNGCNELTSITIPQSVTSINKNAFLSCSKLSQVTISEGCTTIGSGAFGSCPSLTSIVIPDSCTSLGESSFSGDTSLESVVLGSGISKIYNYTFSRCTHLASLTIKRTTPPTMSYAAYTGIDNAGVIYVPSEAVETYKSNSSWSRWASKIQAITE